MITNGYVLLYLPDHPRAMSNGCVYEHIVQAEKKLGRFLSDKEVVHQRRRAGSLDFCKLWEECPIQRRILISSIELRQNI